MREIKFRAWDQQDKVMTICRNLNDWIEAYAQAEYDTKSNMNYIFKRFIWLQFTGLKDRDGKDVYEGDILYDEYADEQNEEFRRDVIEVFFQDGTFVGMVKGSIYAECLSEIGKDFYVAGNIYENHELKSVTNQIK